MKKELIKNLVIVLLIFIAALSRLIPHPSNFTALGAIAIFSAFLIENRLLALLIPVVAMYVSDLILNNIIYSSSEFIWFTSGAAWIYLGMISHSFIAWILRKPSTSAIAVTSLAGAIAFFLLSNFGVWLGSGMYERTSQGLTKCYIAALPFFGNVLASNLIFSCFLFAVYFILEKRTESFQTI